MLQVPNKLDPRGFFCRKGNHPNTKNFRKKQQQQRKKKQKKQQNVFCTFLYKLRNRLKTKPKLFSFNQINCNLTIASHLVVKVDNAIQHLDYFGNNRKDIKVLESNLISKNS